MNKNVLIISSSLRTGSNSEILAREVAKGAMEGNNHVDLISLSGKKINFCEGCCHFCRDNLKCKFNDDASDIIYKLRDADVIIFASPIYYYDISGTLKTLLDRCNPIYYSECNFKDVYLLATAAEASKDAINSAVETISGWVSCFSKAQFKNSFLAFGVEKPYEINNFPKFLNDAYNLGRNV